MDALLDTTGPDRRTRTHADRYEVLGRRHGDGAIDELSGATDLPTRIRPATEAGPCRSRRTRARRLTVGEV